MKPPLAPLLLAAALSAGCVDAPSLGPGVYCDEAAPCTSDPRYPLCDPFRHQCVEADGGEFIRCASSGDCTETSLPLCDPDHHVCVPCAADPDPQGCAARNDKLPRCEASTGRCVACLPETAATDCPGALPVCAEGACRLCRSHGECASRVCLEDGQCAPASMVAYVDNAGGACSGTHTGTASDPHCEIRDAVELLGSRTFIRIAGSAVPYLRIEVITTGPPLTYLIGDGRDAGTRSTITDPTGPCIDVEDHHALVVDGLELAGCKSGVTAWLSGTVTVIRSFLHGMTAGPAIDIHQSDGVQRLDGLRVADNQVGGGVAVFRTRYDIQNCFIASNAGDYVGGVSVDGSTGTFAFNTVRNNRAISVAGGIDCGNGVSDPATVALRASIVVGNSLTPMSSQLASSCRALESVVVGAGGEPPATGLIFRNPAWLLPLETDYHLQPLPQNAALIDAVTATKIDHDIDGNPRPRGSNWDIGAQEVE